MLDFLHFSVLLILETLTTPQIEQLVLDDDQLVIAHAGMRADLQGRASAKVREFVMYGETTGEADEFGLPIRHNWAQDYRSVATVVYGHTPVPRFRLSSFPPS